MTNGKSVGQITLNHNITPFSAPTKELLGKHKRIISSVIVEKEIIWRIPNRVFFCFIDHTLLVKCIYRTLDIDDLLYCYILFLWYKEYYRNKNVKILQKVFDFYESLFYNMNYKNKFWKT